jgi:serine acetyltransferase
MHGTDGPARRALLPYSCKRGPGHDGRVNPLRTLSALAQLARAEAADAEQRARLGGVRYASRVIIRGADRISVGRNVFIDHGAYLNPSSINERRGFIAIGDNVEIGPYCVLWGGGGLTIGNNVHLGAHAHITTQAGHPMGTQDRGPFVVDVAPVVIGDNVLIYSGAIVVPGVRIGAAAIVAAGAVVIEDVDAGTFVAGVPARARAVAVGRNAG